MIKLSNLVKRPKSPLSKRQLLLVNKWVDEDWESHDVDREILKLIQRLLLSTKKKMK
ncbi:MAG TPA: hypothetical protein VII94_05480 [Candidatus Saccharimonadales bacterium]